MTDKPKMRLVGLAFAWAPLEWQFGWATPVEENGEVASSFESGHRWLCLGPIALMFERPLESETEWPT